MKDTNSTTLLTSEAENADRYIRVRTDYYKIVNKPMTDGTRLQQLIKWRQGTIKADHGRDFADDVPHYDDFIIFPDNVNFKQVIDGKFWNMYFPMEHTPVPGEFPHIDQLVSHIFGEQRELGYDYLQLLYLQPRQKLPILILTSKERNTGKSTFLYFLQMWFGGNLTFNSSDDFNSNFNADWAGVLLVCIDEAMLNKREQSERLKNLSTALHFKIEAKGKDKVQQEFFAKFVLCSNNVDKPIIIDPGETRYWVREVPVLECDDVDFLSKIEKEIPHLMYHLLHERKLSVPRTSRMYFNPKDLLTPALQRIMMNSRSQVEASVFDLCMDVMDSMEIDSFSFVSGDIRQMLADKGIKADDSSIRRVLKDNWHLKPNATPSTYNQYVYGVGIDGNYNCRSGKGRYYTVSRKLLLNLYENCRFVDNEHETTENKSDSLSTKIDECPF